MAKNTLVFGEPFEMNDFTIDIDPKGIIWSNVQRGPSWKLVFSTNMANILGVAITVGWVVPVSFVGLVIQLPYLTTLIPYARWLNALPKIVKEVIAGILPTIALTCLTEIAQAMFRKLSLMRGVLTMAELELDLQRWYFSFLFVQVFLVVTISSGIMVIVEVALYNPTSLATIVARDLPKASSFFYSFFLLRGFTICGNVLLRLTELLKFLFHRRFVDSSEVNQKMRMAANAPRFRLGMLYPTVSLFGTIALVYAILAPLILVGTTISLMLIFIGYKYCFKNVFYRENHSETYGKLYTVALLQLYSGIYCLEICLIGFFGIVKDDSGIPCFNLSMGMILVFVATIITHTSILRKFSVPMAVLPLSLDNGLERDQNRVSTATRLGYLPASFGMCADQSPKM
ncbi:unnamed protein product [Kuraishia capsulata CBS 1993]|uniref:CSC1/OSCA1-like 7TM region domain-containing protein n=1 Tax=Kuraishia capsulata CBS 1993 TaxID=1382522 RepID=W6MMB1_9ASCO|nr:uncharacterized protein KUCA_T00001998001 [Kuraishia capsulata CBS 1993]CDK26027.1 unnamed protein product [Kuraishia capsulata CBS 1993]